MDGRHAGRVVVLGVVVLGVVALVGLQTGTLPVPVGDYETRELRVTDCDGDRLARMEVRVASSAAQQYVGLSRTQALEPNEGMVFVDDRDRERQIVMRGMSFPLDVLFVGSDGRVRSVTTLDAPAGPVEYYLTYSGTSGRGQYVVEMSAGWANRTGISAGDCVENLP